MTKNPTEIHAEIAAGLPLQTVDLSGAKTRTQVAALCWRFSKGKPVLLLITSRDTGRWVIPKGWPMKALDDPQAAAQEAYEEAGVRGEVSSTSLGIFGYHKVLEADKTVPCAVTVFALKVTKRLSSFPEQAVRRRKWVSPKKAATMVAEPDLQALLKSFTPPQQ